LDGRNSHNPDPGSHESIGTTVFDIPVIESALNVSREYERGGKHLNKRLIAKGPTKSAEQLSTRRTDKTMNSRPVD